MKRFSFVLPIVLLVCGCSKTPEEAAQLYCIMADNGFQQGGGVAITDAYIITSSALFGEQKTGQITSSKKAGIGVARQTTAGQVALLYAEDEVLPFASIGSTDDLAEGAKLATYAYDNKGAGKLLTGVVRGWQYGDGTAFIVTDIDSPETANGNGYFGPDGKLIGIQLGKLGKSTLILPVEYITNGPKAITSGQLGDKQDSENFAAQRKKGQAPPDPLPKPLLYDEVTYEMAFSRTALVGAMVMLDKKDAASRAAPVKFKVEAVDQSHERTVTVQGTIDAANIKWAPMADQLEKIKESSRSTLGATFVTDNLDPYDYGELRFRLPFAPFCPKVEGDKVYVLNVELSDGRKVSENFNDMANVCAGEGGEGDGWEKEWGMAGEAAAAASAGTPSKKSKRKAKKHGRRRR
ncbi:MAG: hypothetical protein A2341_13085 [Deltaproteobacteria bacterium RIFOXYB12_FULL_58_9]|nr:MAG: hypothetical protein A2341_13085 [Deltaproteobacteria bacterium RIFOXYB12_FULL_58_9]